MISCHVMHAHAMVHGSVSKMDLDTILAGVLAARTH